MNHSTIDIQPCQALLSRYAEKLHQFEQLLVDENAKYNLTRITSPQQVQTRHFLDSLAAIGLFDALAHSRQRPLRILDVGSGAGFPGLVLATVRPEWSFVSLEATDKKARFQETVCKALNLTNIQVLHGRAEEAAHKPAFREAFDAVTARALAPMPVLAELVLAFLRQQGLGIFWKGSSAAEETTAAETAIRQMGGTVEQIAAYTLSDETQEAVTFSLVVCRKISASPPKYPRVFGIIKKHPLNEISNP
jgi:16S rRNA (guanine527-N7)-methyltransferase